jgi:hypothetical protein
MNKADYFTKHHPATHHQAIRSTYLYAPDNPSRNYFECLQDEDDTECDINKVPGEGVLITPNSPNESEPAEHDSDIGSSALASQQPLTSPERQSTADHSTS